MPVAMPQPAASAPRNLTPLFRMNGWNVPMALLPPPTQATSRSGSFPSWAFSCLLISFPMMLWKSRTMVGIGVRSGRRPEHVVGRFDGCRPVPERLADGVLEGSGADLDLIDLGAHQPHAEHVHALALDVLGAHVDLRLHSQHRRGHRRRGPVLPGAGLGDDARLAHALCQQRLSHDVVELVGPAVRQVLPLQVDLGPAVLLREAPGEVQRGLPAAIVDVVPVELFLERPVVLDLVIDRSRAGSAPA